MKCINWNNPERNRKPVGQRCIYMQCPQSLYLRVCSTKLAYLCRTLLSLGFAVWPNLVKEVSMTEKSFAANLPSCSSMRGTLC